MIRRLCVIYDARCGLCRRARRWLEAQDSIVDLGFVAAGSATARRSFPSLASSDRPEELIVVADDGGVYRGERAWILCLWALEDYREWAERLASPALLPLARQGFALVSRQRGRISRWLGLASEEEVAEALAGVTTPACEVELPARLGPNLAGPEHPDWSVAGRDR